MMLPSNTEHKQKEEKNIGTTELRRSRRQLLQLSAVSAFVNRHTFSSEDNCATSLGGPAHCPPKVVAQFSMDFHDICEICRIELAIGLGSKSI